MWWYLNVQVNLTSLSVFAKKGGKNNSSYVNSIRMVPFVIYSWRRTILIPNVLIYQSINYLSKPWNHHCFGGINSIAFLGKYLFTNLHHHERMTNTWIDLRCNKNFTTKVLFTNKHCAPQIKMNGTQMWW